MCQKIKYLNQTQNGLLICCSHSENYQLSFKNLNFNLTPAELESFVTFLLKIDVAYWEKEYENSVFEKKIPIPTLQTNFIILIDRYELSELICLLDFNERKEYLTYRDIKYPVNFN
ncbi:DUF6686 family protein [Flavobacterium sp.]|uniref:DUF6686 family protein n=1 Tax=Flavobacterium sp. TaxID=239 RepID=UPI003D6B1160